MNANNALDGRYAELAFEVLYPKRQGRLRYIATLRRTCEVMFVRQCDHVFELPNQYVRRPFRNLLSDAADSLDE